MKNRAIPNIVNIFQTKFLPYLPQSPSSITLPVPSSKIRVADNVLQYAARGMLVEIVKHFSENFFVYQKRVVIVFVGMIAADESKRMIDRLVEEVLRKINKNDGNDDVEEENDETIGSFFRREDVCSFIEEN